MLDEWGFWVVVFSIIVGAAFFMNVVFGDERERKQAINTLIAIIAAGATVVASVFAMTFVIKPALAWFFGLF